MLGDTLDHCYTSAGAAYPCMHAGVICARRHADRIPHMGSCSLLITPRVCSAALSTGADLSGQDACIFHFSF